MPDNNPLLQHWDLPPWSTVRAEHLVPAITSIIARNRQAITDIVATQIDVPNWDDLVLAVDETDARLDEAMALIAMLSMTRSEEIDWIIAVDACRTFKHDYKAWRTRHQGLLHCYRKLEASPIARNFNDARKAALAKILRTLRVSGIELSVTQQEELSRLNGEINRLEALFLSNLDNVEALCDKHVNDIALLEGLTPAMLQRFAQRAEASGQQGWLIPLDWNTHQHIMRYAKNRSLREEHFFAYSTRASDQGPLAGQFDNGPVLKTLLRLRQQKAGLLGFDNFAHFRLATETTESTAQIRNFLHRQIASIAKSSALDANTLKALAHERGMVDMQAWDQDFLVEQLRQQNSAGALKGLRNYFPLEGTLRRLCLFSERMFGISIKEKVEFDRWDDQLRLLELSEHSQVIGHILIDPFQRPGSMDFAGTVTLRNRHMSAEGRPTLPIALLSGNFPAETAGHPCLLDHYALRVLFHEFGHCLQHILTRSPHYNLSGISQLNRASAEFAGQVFEQWCLSREFLLWLAAHHQSGERLTEKRVDAALTALQTQTSRATAILLMSALLDLELHASHGDGRDVQQVFDAVQRELPYLQLPAYCRFVNGFDYLVTGYEASVYAYKWSGILATEAFKRFQQEGVFNPQTGRAFREAFFSPGDSRSLLNALEEFLGRPVSPGLLETITD